MRLHSWGTLVASSLLILAAGDAAHSYDSILNAQQLREHPGRAARGQGRESSHLQVTYNFSSWVQRGQDYLQAHNLTVSEECDISLGAGYIQKFRQGRRVICNDTHGPADSCITAFTLEPKHAVTSHRKLLIADSQNIVFDSAAFTTAGALGPKGSLKASCEPRLAGLQDFMTEGTTKIWLGQALEGGRADEVHSACAPGSTNVVEHPVLLLTRWDSTNAYHSLEDITTVLVALAVTGQAELIMEKGLQVLIADDMLPGFYLSVWHKLSLAAPVRILSKDPLPAGTCFRHVLHSQFAGWSLLSYKGVGTADTCRSPVITGVSLYLRSRFAHLAPAYHSVQNEYHLQTKGIIWISRRNFEALHKLYQWQQQRQFKNEAALQLALLEAVLRWNNRACFRKNGHVLVDEMARRLLDQFPAEGLSTMEQQQYMKQALQAQRRMLQEAGCRDSKTVYSFETVEPSDTAFYPDQVFRYMRAHILVAVHGAGLANMIWMEPAKGGVIELAHNRGGNYHYHNMAHFLGHKYAEVISHGQVVDTSAAAAALTQMMDNLAQV